jgi:hypothetical protein
MVGVALSLLATDENFHRSSIRIALGPIESPVETDLKERYN